MIDTASLALHIGGVPAHTQRRQAMAARTPRTLSTAQAAELVGIAPDSFRATMTRLRAQGVDLRVPEDQWPDKRTPLWDAARLRAWIRTRPGSGRWASSRTP